MSALSVFCGRLYSRLIPEPLLRTGSTSVDPKERSLKILFGKSVYRLLRRVLSVQLLIPVLASAQIGFNENPFEGRESIPEEEFEPVRVTRVLEAVPITSPINVDGYLDETVWALAQPATDFIQVLPRVGVPARERTEVRFLYDSENLYVGFYMFDSDVGNLTINDLRDDFSFLQSDAVSLILDSLHDRRSGFAFAFNPGGARRDLQISNDNRSNPDWDGVWELQTMIDDTGWGAELSIPFNTLRFSQDEIQEWGMQVQRRIPRYPEESSWTPVAIRFRGIRVSISGTLTGLEGLNPGRNFKLTPFATAGLTQVRSGDQMVTTRSLGRIKDYDGGLDAKLSLTPSLTLDATYRTDFAQVEVDQQQVNLTRFNLFFPEKREFFLENSGTFNFGPGGNLVPFFSRRIGLSDSGTPIPIVGGARVTGQIDRYDVGFIAMKTEDAAAPGGSVPSNSYVVGRVKRNFLSTSWVGGMATSRNSTADGDHNRVYGADAHFEFYGNKLGFDSYLIASDTPGLSGRNQARRFETSWRDNEFRLVGQYNEVQENFNPEVGFVRRENMEQYASEVAWLPQLRNNDSVRNFTFRIASDYIEGSTSDSIETRIHDAQLGVQFENSASINFTASRAFDRLTTPTRIRGIEIPQGDYAYQRYTVDTRTNNNLKVSGSVRYQWGEFWNGNLKSFQGTLALKPNEHLSIDLNYDRNNLNLSGQTTDGDLVGARFLYAFTARAFLNAFFQYNSTNDEVSSNIRFNWKYRPLSDIYIVYNERRSSVGNDPLERALIVKLTRLINF